MALYKNKYRIPSARLDGYDYGSHGFYYITICTKNRIHYFGDVVETNNCPSLRETATGKIANEYWIEIPKHYPFVELDEFIIMPNYMHGILFLNRPEYNEWNQNIFGRQSQNIPAIIRAYKSSVKRYANEKEHTFEWQSRYHDHVIRDEKELNNIRNYIANNLQNWANDEHNTFPT